MNKTELESALKEIIESDPEYGNALVVLATAKDEEKNTTDVKNALKVIQDRVSKKRRGSHE